MARVTLVVLATFPLVSAFSPGMLPSSTRGAPLAPADSVQRHGPSGELLHCLAARRLRGGGWGLKGKQPGALGTHDDLRSARPGGKMEKDQWSLGLKLAVLAAVAVLSFPGISRVCPQCRTLAYGSPESHSMRFRNLALSLRAAVFSLN